MITLKQLVTAQPAMQKLILQDLPLKKALRLMHLVEAANVHLKFFTIELTKCGDDAARIAELEVLELDDVEPIDLPVNDNLRLSAADIKNLEGIIEFIESEDIG